MAAGYALGPVMELEAESCHRCLLKLGAAITAGFVLLRATNFYGDPAPWTIQETWPATVLSFLNCENGLAIVFVLVMYPHPARSGFVSLDETDAALSLPGVYVVWLFVLILLYPLCRWFAEVKQSHTAHWWSYL
jgi:uncharacterized membrane protein